MKKGHAIAKNIFDYIGAAVGLILLSPIFIAVGILIKIDSKGPILFKQERLGKDGKVFTIYKFRTMVENAEKMGDGIFIYEGDNRITKLGDFLRRTSLDELPQLINILLGDMSFVGPRPPITYYPWKYEEYEERKKQRFKMKPGITGLAQIKGRNDLEWDEKIEYDIEYLRNFTFFLDLKILYKTFFSVMEKKNIY